MDQYDEPNGLVPVEIDGFVNGLPFYYRNRLGNVSFIVGSDPTKHALDSAVVWSTGYVSLHAVPQHPDHNTCIAECLHFCDTYLSKTH